MLNYFQRKEVLENKINHQNKEDNLQRMVKDKVHHLKDKVHHLKDKVYHLKDKEVNLLLMIKTL